MINICNRVLSFIIFTYISKRMLELQLCIIWLVITYLMVSSLASKGCFNFFQAFRVDYEPFLYLMAGDYLRPVLSSFWIFKLFFSLPNSWGQFSFFCLFLKLFTLCCDFSIAYSSYRYLSFKSFSTYKRSFLFLFFYNLAYLFL